MERLVAPRAGAWIEIKDVKKLMVLCRRRPHLGPDGGLSVVWYSNDCIMEQVVGLIAKVMVIFAA